LHVEGGKHFFDRKSFVYVAVEVKTLDRERFMKYLCRLNLDPETVGHLSFEILLFTPKVIWICEISWSSNCPNYVCFAMTSVDALTRNLSTNEQQPSPTHEV
jgi:hypothetical protein